MGKTEINVTAIGFDTDLSAVTLNYVTSETLRMVETIFPKANLEDYKDELFRLSFNIFGYMRNNNCNFNVATDAIDAESMIIKIIMLKS